MHTYKYTSPRFEPDDIELVRMFLSQFKDGDAGRFWIDGERFSKPKSK
jgi:hypothetical protein